MSRHMEILTLIVKWNNNANVNYNRYTIEIFL